jgi:DNA-binding protein HU-beta
MQGNVAFFCWTFRQKACILIVGNLIVILLSGVSAVKAAREKQPRRVIMNKTELINAVAETSGLTKKDSEVALNAILDTIQNAMKSGDKVQLVGFGSFEVKERAARTGKNPATGATIEIPASKAPAFKAGKALKDAIQ